MLLRDFPNTLVHTSGPSVGLPEGQMGNSEVGHLNIGAGRVVHMDVTRIDLMIASGEFYENPLLLDRMHYARAGRRLHLMGLCSDGGVHSLQEHLYALLRMAKQEKVRGLRPLLHGRARHAARKRHRLYSRSCSKVARDRRGAASRRYPAVITLWIATSAGSASRRRLTPWSWAKAKSPPIPQR